MNIFHINLNGQQYPLSFGMATHAALEDSLNCGQSEFIHILQKKPLSFSIELVYQGMKDGYRKEGKDFKLSKEDIADLLDQSEEGIEDVFNAFLKSLGVETEEQEEDNQKKS